MQFGRNTQAPPSILKIYGERCSGTNFVETLLFQNFPDLTKGNSYPWEKHNFVNPPFVRESMVAVVVTRDAFDWIRSLHRSPHQVAYWYRNTDFSGFLRHEWSGIFNGFLINGQGRLGIKGQELMYERHPDTGAAISNVVELRNLKMRSQLKVPNLYQNWIIARFEDVRDNPQTLVDTLTASFGCTPTKAFKPVEEDVSNFSLPSDRKGKGRERPYAEFSAEDRDFVLGGLNLQQEKKLGYDYSKWAA
jgi:hypothetical protein